MRVAHLTALDRIQRWDDLEESRGGLTRGEKASGATMMRRLACAALAVLAIRGQLVSGAEQRVQHVRTSARHADRVEMRRTHEAWEASSVVEVQEQAGPDVHSAWEGELAHGEEDIFAHVRPLIEHQEKHRDSVQAMSLVETGAAVGTKAGAGVGKVHAFCEICILIMQMKERGQPHLCAGLNPDYFISARLVLSGPAFSLFLRVGSSSSRRRKRSTRPPPARLPLPNLPDHSLRASPAYVHAIRCPTSYRFVLKVCLSRHAPHLLFSHHPSKTFAVCRKSRSILRSDKAVVYWLCSGCMHLDREGPEIVKLCPAHAICAWVPNLFADVGIISPRNSWRPSAHGTSSTCRESHASLPLPPRCDHSLRWTRFSLISLAGAAPLAAHRGIVRVFIDRTARMGLQSQLEMK